MASIREILAVEETNLADVFRGPAVESRIERTFGGQIAAQAVAAAQCTVSGKDIHSLHGYFVGPGDASQPIEIRVCLLYTSPSPRDRTRSRMPSSA